MSRYRYCAALLTALLLTAFMPVVAKTDSLVADGEIALEGVRGRIDHLAIDLLRQRLLVAELGNNTVDIVDVARRRREARITGLAEPQGVGVAARADRYVIANAGDGTVRFYRADDLRPASSVSLGSDADNVRVDAKSGNVLVGYGSGGIAIIDPATGAKTGTLELPAHPEGFQLDHTGARIYVNLPDAHRIAVIDRLVGRVAATWNTPGLSDNFPMAIDNAGSRLAVVFRNPPTLVLYNAVHGEVQSRIHTCGDADDVFFDAKRTRFYVSCGSGAIDVFDAGSRELKHLTQVATASGARTSLFVPELDRLFVGARAGDASIRIFRPAP
jgi:DNA-binding beta-propeller fold protein YncE